MRILDENDKELTESQVDLSVGYLTYEQIFKEHHDAVGAVDEQGHYYPSAFYFTDGSKYVVDGENENDPHVAAVDGQGTNFKYVASDGEAPRTCRGCDIRYIVDTKRQEAKDAYDEMEDIQRYKLYTEQELADKKAAEEKEKVETDFMENGPSRLTSVETDLSDMTLTIADLIGV